MPGLLLVSPTESIFVTAFGDAPRRQRALCRRPGAERHHLHWLERDEDGRHPASSKRSCGTPPSPVLPSALTASNDAARCCCFAIADPPPLKRRGRPQRREAGVASSAHRC